MQTEIADALLEAVRAAEPELRSADERLAALRPAPGEWTIKETLGHLIDSASNNHQRFVRAQNALMLSSPAYAQNDWVSAQRYNEEEWVGLVDLWTAYNRHLAHVIRVARKDSLAVLCMIGENEPVTLEFLMEDYVSHLQHHLEQLSERMRIAGGNAA